MSVYKIVKGTALAAVLAVSLNAPKAEARTGFPVFDFASLSKDIADFIQTNLKWAKDVKYYYDQITEMKQQYEKMKQQYDAITGIKFGNILDSGTDGMIARSRIRNIYTGVNEDFGLGLPTIPSESMLRYSREYQFTKPAGLYTDEAAQKAYKASLDAAYVVDSTTHSMQKASEERFRIYEDIMANKGASSDQKSELEIMNALLVENGRNLATLIDLQTAALAADGAQLRKYLDQQQAVSSMFGGRKPE